MKVTLVGWNNDLVCVIIEFFFSIGSISIILVLFILVIFFQV